jgi:hypothetical protein
MRYIPQTIKFTVTVPKTEGLATDYIYLYDNGGSGDIDDDNPISPKVQPVSDGTDWVFTYRLLVDTPGMWKFKYTIFDSIGNAGSSSADHTVDLTGLVPMQAATLKYISYNTTTKVLSLTA